MADSFTNALQGLKLPGEALSKAIEGLDFTLKSHEAMSILSRAADETEADVWSVNYLAEVQKANSAEEFCDRLEAQIKMFDEELDQDHEVGVKLVTFGQAITFHVTRLGFHNPSLMFFFGETADGEKVQLIQHVSQISFVLMAMPKPDPDQPKRVFGFAQGHESIEEASQ